MARTGITPNPPTSSRNPPPKPRRNHSSGNPSSSCNPPRDPSVPSNRAQRPAPSQSNQLRPTPPQTSATVCPTLDYKLLYPWAPPALLSETSSINTEADVLRLRDKTHLSFSKEHDDKVAISPCLPGEPVCTDNEGNDDHPFCFIYLTVFKKVKLRFPLTRFERELLTELDIAPAQLHPDGWAFVRAYQIICTHLGHPASVEVFLFLFEANNPGDRLWVSFNGFAGRSILSIFQQSYKDWKGKFVRVCCNDQDPTLLDGFPLYWVNKGKKESKDTFRKARSPEKMGELDQDLCSFWKELASSNIILATSLIIKFEFVESQLDFHIGMPSLLLRISLSVLSPLYSSSNLLSLHRFYTHSWLFDPCISVPIICFPLHY